MFKFDTINPLNKIRDEVNSKVNESRLPNEKFESTVGVYGGKIDMQEDGKMVWNNKGLISKIDKFGDAILRTYDEHVVKDLSELFQRHPKLFFKFLAPGTKRYRGNKEEIFSNIKRLGLEDTYNIHDKGIEIKDQDAYLKGCALQDLYRSDLIKNEEINSIDRFQALAEAGKYVRTIHDEHGGIGELLVSDIIFKQHEKGQVENPVLNIPDIIFNEKKIISEKEKKATDILDFIMSVGAEEFRRSSGDLLSVRMAMQTVLENYGDKNIIRLVKSYIKRGRLTLAGDTISSAVNLPEDSFTSKSRAIFTKHNEARVVNDKELEAELKNIALELCELSVK